MIGQEIMERAKKEKRSMLTEVEAKELLRDAGISAVDTRLATSKEEAVSTSKELGFPVVLKIASADVVHKSDAGGVKLDLETPEQVGNAYDDILGAIKKEYPQAKIQGVSVQKMARPGVEVIMGMSKDAQFGPVLMFGLGGILVEILKDVSFRIVPLVKRDAAEMIREIVSNLEELLLKVSDFVEKNPDIKELDLNPIFAYKDGAVAVDARVVLEEAS